MRLTTLMLLLLATLLFAGKKTDKSPTAQESTNNQSTTSVASDSSKHATYIADHPSLPEMDLLALKKSEIRIGIQVETVVEILGKPDEMVNVETIGNEEATMNYASLGKIITIKDTGGSIVVVGIQEVAPQE